MGLVIGAAPPGTSLHCSHNHRQLRRTHELEGARTSAQPQRMQSSQHGNDLLQLRAVCIQVQLQHLELILPDTRLA